MLASATHSLWADPMPYFVAAGVPCSREVRLCNFSSHARSRGYMQTVAGGCGGFRQSIIRGSVVQRRCVRDRGQWWPDGRLCGVGISPVLHLWDAAHFTAVFRNRRSMPEGSMPVESMPVENMPEGSMPEGSMPVDTRHSRLSSVSMDFSISGETAQGRDSAGDTEAQGAQVIAGS